jgi:hypothetical protein
MAGRFVRGFLTGLAVGLVAVAAISVLAPRPHSDATAAGIEPAAVERTYGPRAGGLPRLRSDTAPAQPATPPGDE